MFFKKVFSGSGSIADLSINRAGASRIILQFRPLNPPEGDLKMFQHTHIKILLYDNHQKYI
jgi:hypothetical protein